MFAVFYVLYFNLLSTFMLKVISCAKGRGLTSKTNQSSSQSHSQTATKEEKTANSSKDLKKPKSGTPVILKKSGIFGESSPRILTSESNDLISLCRFTKITLEDKNSTKRGDGDCWKLSNLQFFKIEMISTTSRKFHLDYDIFEIMFENEPDAKQWDQYFQSWANKYASHSMLGESMLK